MTTGTAGEEARPRARPGPRPRSGRAADRPRTRIPMDSLTIDLASACYPTRERLRAVGAITMSPSDGRTAGHRFDGPGPTAHCLLGLAAGMLPAGRRRRYAEEFRAELIDQPRPTRVLYALRVVGRSWALRQALSPVGLPRGSTED